MAPGFDNPDRELEGRKGEVGLVTHIRPRVWGALFRRLSEQNVFDSCLSSPAYEANVGLMVPVMVASGTAALHKQQSIKLNQPRLKVPE